ncbi:MAG: PASTA domain-containing protein [Candidatus Muiribacteriota bacterium]
MKKKKDGSIFTAILYIITFVVLVRGMFVGTIYVIEDFFNEGQVRVPDFVGMSLNDAMELAPRYKLRLEVKGEAHDEHLEKNYIIKQDPISNFSVKKGRTIEFIISKGKKESITPNLRGISVREAERVILQNNFSIGRKSYVYSDEPEGVIVSQQPLAGINYREGQFISMLVSKGDKTEYVILPEFIGGNYNNVKDTIRMMGLEVGNIKYDFADEKEPGEIIDQQPASGTRLEKGAEINLRVNRNRTTSRQETKRKTVNFEYEIPDGRGEKELKVILIDDLGIREVHRSTYSPEARASFTLHGSGRMKALIYIDNLKVDEREY